MSDPDHELIALTLRNIGSFDLPSRIGDLRAKYGLPMEDVLDWLYGNPGREVLSGFEAHCEGIRLQRERQLKAKAPCAFCGGAGVELCCQQIAWLRSDNGKRVDNARVCCDLPICVECVNTTGATSAYCPLHSDKDHDVKADCQVLTRGMVVAVNKQLRMAAENWSARTVSLAALVQPEQALQRGLFDR